MKIQTNAAARPMYIYLMVLTFAQAWAFFGWNVLYTNFAVEAAHLTGAQNGIVQAFREAPGLLSVGVVFLLMVMREVTLTSAAILLCGLGVATTGWFPSFGVQIFWTLLLSFGFHYLEATNQSLTLQYFSTLEAPLVIGRLRAITAMASFLMGLFVVFLADHVEFRWIFMIAGSVAAAAGLWGFFQRPEAQGLPPQRRGMVLKKEYWLFYLLTGLSGARRQVFTVFSIFLLVERFHFSLFQMSLLFLAGNLISWFLNPLIGQAINAVGERRLLTVKYIAIIGVCLAYAFAQSVWVVAALYILDQLLFCFTISIRTYFQKIAQPEDIAPSMAMGVTVNHIAAVAVPFIGGLMWMVDYRIPFLMGVGFAALSLLATQLINIRRQPAIP